jgi:TolA-binding protein
MGLKETYQEKIEAQLKEWTTKIRELQAKAEMAKADTKIELQKRLLDLHTKRQAAQQKLKDLQATSADAWEKARPDLEKALDNLKSAWENVKKSFSG